MDRRRRENVLQEGSQGRKRGISEPDKTLNSIIKWNVSVFNLHGHSKHFCLSSQLDPKRLKKDLPKSLKLIKGEDRVLIVGTSTDPLSADIKSLCKMYSKIILIPRPDYGSRCSKNLHILVALEFWLLENVPLNPFAFSPMEPTDQEAGRGCDQGTGPRLSCEDFWWLHTRSHGPGDPEHRHQAPHPAAGQQTADGRRVCGSTSQDWPCVSGGRRGPQGQCIYHILHNYNGFVVNECRFLFLLFVYHQNWYAKTPLGKKRIKAATGKEEEDVPVKGKDAKKKGKK